MQGCKDERTPGCNEVKRMLPLPLFFVSVAARGLTGAWCWRESSRLGWEDIGELEGLRGGGAGFAGHRGISPT